MDAGAAQLATPASWTWTCPVCHDPLTLAGDRRRWTCGGGHSFDIARQGYVNLLTAGQRRSREPGDNREMVDARRRFLATGAYDRVSDTLGRVAARAAFGAAAEHGGPVTVLDVGCGEGRHTRGIAAAIGGGPDPVDGVIAGADVSKWAIGSAAGAHPEGCYAVASAADLPVPTDAVDVALDIFGPVFPEELARVVRPGGVVIAAHPGREHLASLRRLVYSEPRPHEVKGPLRGAVEWFAAAGSVTVTFPMVVNDLRALWAMTPYRWHAPPDIEGRLARAGDAFETTVDVVITTYRRHRRP